MKTPEQRVKEIILARYHTMKEFASVCGLPYGTIDGILRRGFGNSNVENVFTICRILGISADELADGKIVFADRSEKNRLLSANITDVVDFIKTNSDDMTELKIDDQSLTGDELSLLVDCVELSIELIRRKRRRESA